MPSFLPSFLFSCPILQSASSFSCLPPRRFSLLPSEQVGQNGMAHCHLSLKNIIIYQSLIIFIVFSFLLIINNNNNNQQMGGDEMSWASIHIGYIYIYILAALPLLPPSFSSSPSLSVIHVAGYTSKQCHSCTQADTSPCLPSAMAQASLSISSPPQHA